MSIYALIAADLIAVSLLVFGMYFPRHRRRDMIVSFLGINVGIMGVTFALSTAELSLGFGLGIFAVLSIIRLRSTELDHAEIAYYFTAIVLGLLGGFPASNNSITLTLMTVLLVVIYVGDHPKVFSKSRRHTVLLDRAIFDNKTAAAMVESMLGVTVLRAEVRKVDLVSDTTVCDVRYTVPDAVAPVELASDARVSS